MTKPAQSDPPSADRACAGRRGRSGSDRRRRFARAGLLALLLLVAGAVLATRSPALRWFLLPRVSEALGGEMTCSAILLGADGSMVVRDLELRAPGVDGAAGRVLRSKRVVLDPDWTALLSGRASVDGLVLIEPVLRVSQGADRSLNVSPLVEGRDAGGGMSLLPELTIVDGLIELGEHGPGGYTSLAQVRVRGGLARSAEAPGSLDVALVEVIGDGPASEAQGERVGVRIAGSVERDLSSASLSATGLDLERWSRKRAPSGVRDLWETLAVAGAVPSVTFSYAPGEGITVSADVEGVAMDIPMPRYADARGVEYDPGARPTGTVRMRGVTGRMSIDAGGFSADLEGSIAGYPVSVTLESSGLSASSALRCTVETESLRIEENPRFLPFAPRTAREVVRRFSGPTAEVSGRVQLERGEPTPSGEPGPWRYEGSFEVTDGEASYEEFPYPITGIDALFVFDQDRFTIARLTGEGPTGASLLATGTIEPPGDGAEVLVDVSLEDVPIDRHFVAGLPPGRAKVYEILFNEADYARLVERGLVLDPDEAAELAEKARALRSELAMLRATDAPEATIEESRARLASVDGALEAPVFELAGRADLDIRVFRPLGADTRYSSDVVLRLDRAGVLTDAFPYPVWARDLELRLSENVATVTRAALEGLSGASGWIEGWVRYSEEPDGPYEPAIELAAETVPVDEYLLAALPEGEVGAGLSARGVLEGLELSGAVSCAAELFADADRPDNIGFGATIDLGGLDADPVGEELPIEGLTGEIVLTRSGFGLREVRGMAGGSAFVIDADATFPDERAGRSFGLTGRARAWAFDVSRPVERLIEGVAPGPFERLASIRDEHDPAGRVDGQLSVSVARGELDFTISAENARGLSFAVDGRRVGLDGSTGGVRINPRTVVLDGFAAELTLDGTEAGRVELDGTVATGPGGWTDVGGRLIGGRFESPIVRRVARSRLGPDAAWVDDLGGRFDLELTLADDGAGERRTAWALEPRSLTLRREGGPVVFDRVTGAIRGTEAGGSVEGLRLDGAGWWVEAEGAWVTEPAVTLELGVKGGAAGLVEGLRRALPAGFRSLLDAAEAEAAGGLALREGRLRVGPALGSAGAALDDPDASRVVELSGVVEGSGVAFDVGAPIDGLEGEASVRVTAQGGSAPEVEVEASARELTCWGVPMTSGRARLRSGTAPGVIVAPIFEAEVLGGKATGRAVLGGSERAGFAGGGRSYEVHGQVSGVRFGPLLARLSEEAAERGERAGASAPVSESGRRAGEDGGSGAGDAAWSGRESANEDGAGAGEVEGGGDGGGRGLLDASVSLTGVVGEPDLRRGRATVRVDRGEVVELPWVMPLLELSNLQPPSGERIDLAYADVLIGPEELTFNTLMVESKSVVITGKGRATWPGLRMDLLLQTSRRSEIPLLSLLVENLRDQLVLARMTGTLYDPEFRLEELSGARRFLDTMLGEQLGTGAYGR